MAGAPSRQGPRVIVSVHGRWHAFALAAGLHRRGMLARLITTYPAFAVRRHVGADAEVAGAPWLELRRRLDQRLGLGGPSDVPVAKAFGAFAAAHLTDAEVFTGWSGASLEAIAPARARGMAVVIERGSTHIAHQARVLAEAHRASGIAGPQPPAEIVERELAEYEAADMIAVPTDHVRDTFIAEGVPAAKLTVNPYGVDLSTFRPAQRRPGEPIRVLFVGGVGVRKGAPWLIEAARALAPEIEVRLVGPVEAGLAPAAGAVRLTGPLRGDALVREYGQADLFCLPSVEEGFPLATLEAMASGLPVVVTPAAAGDAVRDGIEGLVVPDRDAGALAGAITRLAGDADLRQRLGRAGLERVAAGYSWDDYVDRAVAAYEALLAAGSLSRNQA